MYSLCSELLARLRVQRSIRMNLWPFPFFPRSSVRSSGLEALERYIDFYERAEAVKLLYQKDVGSSRVILIKIGESRNQKPILVRTGL